MPRTQNHPATRLTAVGISGKIKHAFCHLAHVPDVPVALYPADDQFDLVVSRLDPRVVHVPADRVRDVLLVAFDLDVRFPERRNPFNWYSRYGFGSSAFQPRAPAILPACSRAARKRFLRASSSESITHSTTWNGQTQRSHPCVDPSTQSVIQRAPSPAAILMLASRSSDRLL